MSEYEMIERSILNTDAQTMMAVAVRRSYMGGMEHIEPPTR